MKKRLGFSEGFTLLELLIVISIIAILSVVVILILNPSEMLKKARDSQRMADLNTIKTAIGLYLVGTNIPYLGLNGNSNTGCSSGSRNIWFSKSGVSGTVDTDATATSSASQSIAGKTNGSGWIPVNLSSLSGGSPISNWPVDPVNSVGSLSSPATTDLVYRYSCNSASQFEVDATLESNAYVGKMSSDGGNNGNYYESGTNLLVISDPQISGLALDSTAHPVGAPLTGSVLIQGDHITPGPVWTSAPMTTPIFSTAGADTCFAAVAASDRGAAPGGPWPVTMGGTGGASTLTWTAVKESTSTIIYPGAMGAAIYRTYIPSALSNISITVTRNGTGSWVGDDGWEATLAVYCYQGNISAGAVGGVADDSDTISVSTTVQLTPQVTGSQVIGVFLDDDINTGLTANASTSAWDFSAVSNGASDGKPAGSNSFGIGRYRSSGALVPTTQGSAVVLGAFLPPTDTAFFSAVAEIKPVGQ